MVGVASGIGYGDTKGRRFGRDENGVVIVAGIQQAPLHDDPLAVGPHTVSLNITEGANRLCQHKAGDGVASRQLCLVEGYLVGIQQQK